MTHPLRPFSCSSTTTLLPLHPPFRPRTSIPSVCTEPTDTLGCLVHPSRPLRLSLLYPLPLSTSSVPPNRHPPPFLVLPVPTRSSSSFLPTARTFRHLLLLRSNDQAARKAGFKIIMARAILITVARTTTHSPTTVYSPPHTLAHTSQQLCL